ncbi:unnamed protein product [Colias eurytheme]|nr:unnamed protein product [Colias eurytheme]
MKILVLLIFIVTVFARETINNDYHESVGIPLASRIKQAEENGYSDSRIYEGSLAELGEFPHMGGLIVHFPSGALSVCGSALLSNTKLVTAAHCWTTTGFQAELFTVVLGSVRLFSGGVRIDTDNVITHPDYNPVNRNNDVAVITIDEVEFSDVISPINLPFNSFSYAGSMASVAGFGSTDDNSPLTLSQVLRKADVQVITNTACQQVYGDSVVIDSTLCTSGTFSNICGGDSGGPLSIHTIDGPQLIGIVSFQSNRGCESGSPAGYARISAFQTWIASQL